MGQYASPSTGVVRNNTTDGKAFSSTANASCSDANVAAVADFPVQIRIQRLAIFTGGIVCVALVSVAMWLCERRWYRARDVPVD